MFMKKMMGVMFLAIFASIACQGETQKKAEVVSEKILVAYFSHGGNTKFAAQQIHAVTGGTLFEIEAAVPYPGDYSKCVNRSKKEISSGIRPPLKSKVKDFKKYDVIFVGSPNWWSTIAPPVSSFLVAYDFSGKTVIPFVTHGGTGISHSEEDVKKLCPKANVLSFGSFTGNRIRKSVPEVKKFVQDSVIIKKK